MTIFSDVDRGRIDEQTLITVNGIDMKQNLNDPAIQPLAERIARAATLVQEQQTGQEPNSVLVVISGKTITVTLRGITSSAEAMREQHREPASHTSESLRRRIQLIIGLEVRAAGSVLEPTSRTAGTVVQTFLLSESVPTETFGEISQFDLHTATLLPAA